MLQRVFGDEYQDHNMSDGRHDENNDHKKDNGKLIAKHIKLDRFSGDMQKWDDWSFKLKRVVNNMKKDISN